MGEQALRDGTYEIWVTNAKDEGEALQKLLDEGWVQLSLEETVQPGLDDQGNARPLQFRIRGWVLTGDKDDGTYRIFGRRVS